jgi:hypothetical protein
MGSGFESADLDTFWETGRNVDATRAVITDGASFHLEVPGVFDVASQDIALGAESGVDVDEPTIKCKATDVAAVRRGMFLTMPDLEAHEDGYGKNYQIKRITGDAGPQSALFYLDEV